MHHHQRGGQNMNNRSIKAGAQCSMYMNKISILGSVYTFNSNIQKTETFLSRKAQATKLATVKNNIIYSEQLTSFLSLT